jgi:hypothetical protein
MPWVVAAIVAALVLAVWPDKAHAAAKKDKPDPTPGPDKKTEPPSPRVVAPIGTRVPTPKPMPVSPIRPVAPVTDTDGLIDGDNGVVEPEGPAVQDQPVPGFFYRAETGDTMSSIARRAYENPRLWIIIRDDPANEHLHSTTRGYETATGGHGPDLTAYYGDGLDGAWGKGHNFPVLYIPRLEE